MDNKQLVALHAAKSVKSGMLVGLGTGSTANFFIDELARMQVEEGLKIITVASSVVSANRARSLGLALTALENIASIDLYVDGADEITPEYALLKGRGYDLVREKLLARAAKEFIVVADPSKLVKHIGEKFAIPVEVIPFAWQLVKARLEAVGGVGDLRQNVAKDGLAITSYGSLVLDMKFENISCTDLNALLNSTPGVVEHGIFAGLATKVLIADFGEITELSM